MTRGAPLDELVNELTRFATYLLDRWRVEAYKEEEDKEQYVYEAFLEAYQSPTAQPPDVTRAFLDKVRFSRLCEAKSDDEVREMVVGAVKLTPHFNPHRGFGGIADFHVELVKRAKSAGGLLKYVEKFRDSKSLYEDLLKLPGVGPVIGLQIIRKLRMSGVIDLSIDDLPIPPADPVRRVLERTGLIQRGLSWDVIDRELRKKFKVPPLVLDVGLWHISFYYCDREEPKCDICPITYVCPKIT